VLKPFKQSVGFQEKHAIVTLNRNQIRLPWGLHSNCRATDSTFDVRRWTFDVRCSNCCVWNYD